MSIINKLPRAAFPIETYNIFQAEFNNPTAGKYDYTNNIANQNQLVIPLKKQYLYFLDRLSFSASIAEGDWLASVDNTLPLPAANATTPAARFFTEKTSIPTFSRPFPAINYKDQMELNFWIGTPIENDNLRVNFTGYLNQIAATVGIPNIYAQISLVIYQVSASMAVSKMLKAIDDSFADFYIKT